MTDRFGEGRTSFYMVDRLARELKLDRGIYCICWPQPDDPRPCTPQTCDPNCKACRVRGRPSSSAGEARWLETGQGLAADVVAELQRLWRTSSIKSRTAPPPFRDRGICGRGHPIEANAKCRPCAAMNARARRRARRRENGA